MEGEYSVLVTRNWDEVRSVMQLVPRQNGCVKCDTSAKLSCPTQCSEGTECGYEVLLDCTSCPKAICVASAEDPAVENEPADVAPASSGGPNIGPIVGGVVGGIAVIAVATYLVWRFCIKAKRMPRETPRVSYVVDPARSTMDEKDFVSRRDQRSSTHTVHSIASTVLTRASNIIQIAYIPGVTNRAQPSSPALLVPPVPPIPMSFAQGGNGGGGGSIGPASPYEDQHFFMPGDLRDSTYSGFSGYSDRTSYARTSYAPRSSIASTIYGRNAAVQAPAVTGMRAKPTVVSVSVRSTDNSTDSETPPPVPNIDFDKYGRPHSALSTFSVGSTFLNNANTATQVRAQVVKVANVKKVHNTPPLSALDRLAPMSPASRSSLSSTAASESPDHQGPFSDPDDQRSSGLGASIEDATRRAAKIKSTRRTSSAIRDSSPFGDEHATKDQ